MVHFVAPLLGAAVLFSGLTGAAPANKRQSSGESTINPANIPSGSPNGSGGQSVVLATSTGAPSPAQTPYNGSPYGQPQAQPYGPGYNYPIYGSGSMSWMPMYSNCVTQCFAQYPPPPAQSAWGSGTPPPPPPPQESGGGNVHNVMVSSQGGALRYSPFYVQANPGDTVVYNFVANVHTVTQSSAALPCNATVGGFASGKQNAGATFSVKVNDTNPIWFYCGVPGHCEAGMFGAINPPMGTSNSNTTVGAMMPVWAGASPDVAAMLNWTNSQAAVASGACGAAGRGWANMLDVAAIDPQYHASIAQNVLFSRAMMLDNPTMFDAAGNFKANVSQIVLPYDAFGQINVATSPNGATPPVNAAANATSSSSSSASSPTSTKKGAAPLGTRSSALGVAAVAMLVALAVL